jgi:uncharacterized protein involved in exopolysaccharide biosynthesis/Mrp family chromosome partitioning ATPase
MNDPIDAEIHPPTAPPSGLTLGDLYYVFFRHKWKILLVFLASVAAAVAIYQLQPALYVSEAKILIRYIVETKDPARSPDTAQVKSPDTQGNSIINSEIEILTSLDLATQVAEAVGPEKILARAGGGNDPAAAADFIQRHLRVEAPRNSTILRLSFRHPDPALARPVLDQIIQTYLKRHVEIHQGTGVLDSYLLNQADQLRLRLAKTDEDLKRLKSEINVISLEDDKRTYIERLAKIRTELMDSEAELAQRQAVVQTLRRALANPGAPAPAAVTTTNASTTATTPAPVIPPDQLQAWQRAQHLAQAHRQNLAELRTRYTDQHILVRTALQRLQQTEEEIKNLEQAHPALASLPSPSAVSASIPTGGSVPPAAAAAADPLAAQLAAETLRITELETRVNVLNQQLRRLGDEAARIVQLEPQIQELERLKRVDEENYRHAKSTLERAHLNESTGAGKITNINTIQKPSPPARELTNIKKPLLLLLVFGTFGGFAWGLLWERFLHRTIKRPVDVERTLDLPLFITVPDAGWPRGVRRLFWRQPRRKATAAARAATPATGTVTPPVEAAGRLDPQPWDPKHALRPYFEGLRDRLITYFEVRKMTHKPKLVAVTSCHRGAGVSTLAAGLAATLSETGDGNVLLVDMNLDRGAAQPYREGQPACGLADALELSSREPAQIQENLYVVSAHESNSAKLPSVLPKRFAHLIPKMKASDYDYIIFDMPPVSQTSVTARLAGFMDMMLMVIESEKSGQDIVQRAGRLLDESRANLAAVLNKHRPYVPQSLSQEL